jgi:hypothetical protein
MLMTSQRERGQGNQDRVRLAILRFSIRSQPAFLKTVGLSGAGGHSGLEFKLRPFSAGSILTLRNKIEPLASPTSLARLLQNRDR